MILPGSGVGPTLGLISLTTIVRFDPPAFGDGNDSL